MKGITLCGDCTYYSMKKHCCTRGATKETDPRAKFYDDCPLPEAEPVRHGRWENTGEYYERGRTSTQYRCSECGRRAGYKQVKLYHYCPNCGARMDGE